MMFRRVRAEGAGTNVQESRLPPLASVAPIAHGFVYPAPTHALGAAPPLTASEAEQASPEVSLPRTLGQGASVVADGAGPGSQPGAQCVDEWLMLFRDSPHEGVLDGKQLNATRSPAPPEGHGGYDIQGDYGIAIDRSTQRQYFGWSDWAASTGLQAGGRGSFTGEHVIIQRIVPGSARGYMPAEMTSPNQARNLPDPWDADIVLGGS